MDDCLINLQICNSAFFFLYLELEDKCYDLNIEPTKRQASKFRNKKGRLYKYVKANVSS